MTRMRSPSYPSIPLAEAIELVRKLHSTNRTNVIDRLSAVQDIGYSGLSGRALSILAALAQYDLIAKAGKGQIKVTQIAVDILHSVELIDRDAALTRAANAPRLFAELRERFPDGIPSENAIRSWLVQQDYADTALGPAIKSFVETNHFIENTIVSDSVGNDDQNESETPDEQQEPETPMQQQPILVTPNITPAAAFANSVPDGSLNKINMNIQGEKVHVSALMDYEGLLKLETKIAGLKALMEPDDDSTPVIVAQED